VRMDITQSNPQQRALLDRFKLFGPPALLFFDANGNEVEVSRVVGEIGAAAFVEKIPAFNGQ
jgi:thiol:disulfide interchange protein DsbD